MPDGALPHWPRALRETLAASYVGLSPSTFRQVVMPAVPPVRLTPGRIAWLREDLDAWLDQRKATPAVDGGAPADDAPPPEAPDDRDPVAKALAHFEASRRSRRPHKAR